MREHWSPLGSCGNIYFRCSEHVLQASMPSGLAGTRHAATRLWRCTAVCNQPRRGVCLTARSSTTRLQATGPQCFVEKRVRHLQLFTHLKVSELYGAGHAKASQASEDVQLQDPPLAGLRLAVAAHGIPHPAKARSVIAFHCVTCHLPVVMRMYFCTGFVRWRRCILYQSGKKYCFWRS